jgi:hypothetical protein
MSHQPFTTTGPVGGAGIRLTKALAVAALTVAGVAGSAVAASASTAYTAPAATGHTASAAHTCPDDQVGARAGGGQTHLGQAGGRITEDPRPAGSTISNYSYCEYITVVNSSRYTLKIISADEKPIGGSIIQAPTDLAPNAAEQVVYGTNAASGAELTLNYLVDGTADVLAGSSQIPTIGFNSAWCTSDNRDVVTTCTAGHGYHATFSWDINTNFATGPFFSLGYQGETWQFHRIGYPNLVLETYGASNENGQLVDIYQNLNQANEDWTWTPDASGDGWGQLRNANSKLCLEQNGTSHIVDQWDCVPGAANELWKPVLDPHNGSALQLKSTGQYLTTNGTTSGTSPATMTSTLDASSGWGARPLN